MPSIIKNNLPVATAILTLVSALVALSFFMAPMRTLPADVREVRDTQIAQTEVLKSLAKASEKTDQIRRDVDRNTTDISHIRRAVDNLERQ